MNKQQKRPYHHGNNQAKNTTPEAVSTANYDAIKKAIYSIPPNLDRAIWFKIVAAVKSELGDNGFELVDSWSQGADSYKAKDMRAMYRSVKRNGGITIKTLFYYAKCYGYPDVTFAKPNAEDLFQRNQHGNQSEEKQAQLGEAAAEIAHETYSRAAALTQTCHPYLNRKKVASVSTIRLIQQPELIAIIGYHPQANGEKLSGSILVVPFTMGKKISTIEMIDEQGRKSSLANGKKQGAFWSTRSLNESEPHILIAEGVATALSASEATGRPAVSAGSCHNLKKVAQALRELHPNATLTILADLGKGEKDAEEAARSVNGKLARPDFGPDCPRGANDFNDLFILRGPNVVRKTIESAVTTSKANRPSSMERSTSTSGASTIQGKKASRSADDQGPDHLTIAREVIQQIGRLNILSTPSGIWIWDADRGIWRNVDDRKIKQETLKVCEQLTPGDVTKSRVEGATEILKTEIYAEGHQWNDNVESINVSNGELSYTSKGWRFGPHVRENYNTTQLPVKYTPGATCPIFSQFLKEVFHGEDDGAEKIQAILEMIGYTMVAHARHEKFIILVGHGSNGKSVLLSAIQALIGSVNCSAVQPSQFGNEFHRAHLHLKLANIVSELSTSGLVDDALKAITSGEPCLVSRKFKDPFVMHPYSTCWFATNHMPSTTDFSNGIFRRAVIITFNRQFKEGIDLDPTLKTKVTSPEELSGILNLATSAYGAALTRGNFTEPISCVQAKDEWRLETDQVAQFIDEMLFRDTGRQELSSTIFAAYTTWTLNNGIKKPLNKQRFSNQLKMSGATLVKGTRGTRMIHGFSLAPALPTCSGEGGEGGETSCITPNNAPNISAK